MNGHVCSLEPFYAEAATVVSAWATSGRELDEWASLRGTPAPADFAAWHADPGVRAFLLVETSIPIGYGECWIDSAEREVELARLIVDPARRGRGIGALLVERLISGAREFAVDLAWVRVVPGNGPALACYARAGFVPASSGEQHELNAPQPRDYIWMRRRI